MDNGCISMVQSQSVWSEMIGGKKKERKVNGGNRKGES